MRSQLALLVIALVCAALAAGAAKEAAGDDEMEFANLRTTIPIASSLDEAVQAVVDHGKKEDKKRYKIAIFAPAMANSQIIWNQRVAEELMKAGHDVTIYMLIMFEGKLPKIDIDPRVRVVNVNGSFGEESLMKDQASFAYTDVSILNADFRKVMSRFGELHKSCELFVKNKEFLSHIESSKYDLAFAHMFNFCPVGIIHKTKIPSWIWLNSGPLVDFVGYIAGVPIPPSYCPPIMMDAGDKLSFVERVKSVIGHLIFKVMWKRMTSDKETPIFRAQFGQDFPDLAELAAKAPLVMVNSDELYDFARPTLSKIVNIGGVGIKSKNAKQLKPEFAERADKAKAIVVMSFGSIAPMYLMPDTWKEAYFHAFAQFPDVHFFLRYENPEDIAHILPKNAYAAKWLPQTDLLLHPKTLGLISHGGYNSVQDVLHAGVPILATGLFGDQPRNAHLVERLGMGINLHKTKVSKESIEAALRRLIEDKSLKANAKRLKSMIATKPVSAETLLVKWTEFVAQHKNLDNLSPYGAQLNFFVYHSLDVLCFFAAVVVALLALLFVVLRSVLRCCGFCKRNTVNEKKKKKKQ